MNLLLMSKIVSATLVSLLFLTGGAVANARPVSVQQASVSIGEVRLNPATKELGVATPHHWAYTFCGRGTFRNLSSGFCGTIACMRSFNRGLSYVVQCRSGTFSKAGGVSGARSWHDGVSRTVYES